MGPRLAPGGESDGQRPAPADDDRGLQALLACHQVAPTSLELEITEDALLEHTQELIHRLRELKELGVTLAIDDFGTGNSSLSYVRKLPTAVIKLDPRCIRDMFETGSAPGREGV